MTAPNERPTLASEPVRIVRSKIGIDASVGRVWTILADVSLMPGLHPHILDAQWLGGDFEARLGARFSARNATEDAGYYETVSEIVQLLPQRTIAWTIEGDAPPPAVCRFDLFPDPDVSTELTVVHQTYFVDLRPGATPPVQAARAFRVQHRPD